MVSEFKKLLSTLFKSHPWHGVSPGQAAPEVVRSYIEIVPTGTVKLELDKETGHLHVDRPQRFSSMCPTLYGFIPQTYCGESVAKLGFERTGKDMEGDGDPLDICVLSEKDFAHGDLFVTVRPIGGLRMIDHGQADDKIIAVLDQDIAYGGIRDVSEVAPGVIERLKHYFLSYKRPPGQPLSAQTEVEITSVYGKEEAYEVIRRSMADYKENFGTEEERLEALKQLFVSSSR